MSNPSIDPSEVRLFSGSSNLQLASAIAARLGERNCPSAAVPPPICRIKSPDEESFCTRSFTVSAR